MYRAKIRSMAAVAVLAAVTAFAVAAITMGGMMTGLITRGVTGVIIATMIPATTHAMTVITRGGIGTDRYYDDRHAYVWRQNRDRYSN
jgi:hypothetical protein